MEYHKILESITSLKELYEFRSELQKDARRNSGSITTLEACQEANYFIHRVEFRIESLERNGVFLDKIKLETKLKKPAIKKATL